jgi:hypothetical protein
MLRPRFSYRSTLLTYREPAFGICAGHSLDPTPVRGLTCPAQTMRTRPGATVWHIESAPPGSQRTNPVPALLFDHFF